MAKKCKVTWVLDELDHLEMVAPYISMSTDDKWIMLTWLFNMGHSQSNFQSYQDLNTEKR